MLHRKTDRREFTVMEFRRFIHAIVLIPARVIRRARTITVRVIGWQPSLDRMFSTWRTIRIRTHRLRQTSRRTPQPHSRQPARLAPRRRPTLHHATIWVWFLDVWGTRRSWTPTPRHAPKTHAYLPTLS
jgi:hypothetical protein